ncbi:tRNA uridine(34) 5-carboxymethylaminomethyl modification radical SAM/GNAT enzyme Elp3 [Candidatus Woesearchaeota archaeon]|nr:tRNA uridine(34) 5-carboxymethylaminomethyl modification radical SAM/GNAT enzyme Elp3 [Candidatus Woesearchaeota archaeon]
MELQNIYSELIQKIKGKQLSKERVSELKLQLCRKYGLKKIPSDFEILLHAEPEDLQNLKALVSKPSRTGSGVAVVAIMTKPLRCPHGKCSYCPGGISSEFGDVPQSYTGHEPASMRGARNRYDAYLQIFNRLEQYTVLGHNYDKVELIVMGGTFPAAPKAYRDSFIEDSYKAMNDFSSMFFHNNKLRFLKFKEFFELLGEIGNIERVQSIQKRLLATKNKCVLEQEQKQNEHAKVRCVALCVETRPDYCQERQIGEMLRYGTTRVELGVQSLKDAALEYVKRGHSVKQTIEATQLLKDSLLKVGYHMMPGLPGTSIDEDLKMLKELFSNPDYRPDALKIYPCMVMPGTALYEEYNKGEYKPITTGQAAKLIADFKRFMPKYCRIMRVQRDIPTKVTAAGVDMTNLRQEVHKVMKKRGEMCQCIRCREPRNSKLDLKNLKIITSEYEASHGTEIFISAEDIKNNLLAGFCRLRIPDKPFRPEITAKSAGIRELHVYGTAAPIGGSGSVQHHGIGKNLLKRAEQISVDDFSKNRMVIISGVGVREYYRKQGYKKQGVYMVKMI